MCKRKTNEILIIFIAFIPDRMHLRIIRVYTVLFSNTNTHAIDNQNNQQIIYVFRNVHTHIHIYTSIYKQEIIIIIVVVVKKRKCTNEQTPLKCKNKDNNNNNNT